MCNKMFDLEDWLSKVCPSCNNKVSWRYVTYFQDEGMFSTKATIRCPQCITEFCPDCGSEIDIEAMKKDHDMPVLDQRLKTVVKSILDQEKELLL